MLAYGPLATDIQPHIDIYSAVGIYRPIDSSDGLDNSRVSSRWEGTVQLQLDETRTPLSHDIRRDFQPMGSGATPRR
jgi:hypothetical protein